MIKYCVLLLVVAFLLAACQESKENVKPSFIVEKKDSLMIASFHGEGDSLVYQTEVFDNAALSYSSLRMSGGGVYFYSYAG